MISNQECLAERYERMRGIKPEHPVELNHFGEVVQITPKRRRILDTFSEGDRVAFDNQWIPEEKYQANLFSQLDHPRTLNGRISRIFKNGNVLVRLDDPPRKASGKKMKKSQLVDGSILEKTN